MPTINPKSQNWFRFDQGLPRYVTIDDNGIYTFGSANQTFVGDTDVQYTGNKTEFALSYEIVSGKLPEYGSVGVTALDSQGGTIATCSLTGNNTIYSTSMTCYEVPKSFRLWMNCGLGYGGNRIKVMFNEGAEPMDWISIYEAGVANYNVKIYYQNINGSWPAAPYKTDVRSGSIGETVTITNDDKVPEVTPQTGIYVYDDDKSVAQTTISESGNSSLEVYFKYLNIDAKNLVVSISQFKQLVDYIGIPTQEVNNINGYEVLTLHQLKTIADNI